MQHLKYYELKLQEYLKNDKISATKKKILFKFRTRMVNVGNNFGNHKECPFCKLDEDSQQHMFECFVMKLKNHKIFHTDQTYENIFNITSKNIINIAELCQEAIRTRELIFEENNGETYV